MTVLTNKTYDAPFLLPIGRIFSYPKSKRTEGEPSMRLPALKHCVQIMEGLPARRTHHRAIGGWGIQ